MALIVFMGACSSSLTPGGTGGSGAGDAGSPGTGAAGTGGTGRAVAGDAGTAGTNPVGGTTGSGGTAGTVGTGGAAGCANRAPTDSPFNCKPTFDEQVPALCATQTVYGAKHVGVCDSSEETFLSAGFYSIQCVYDHDGSLAWARRCEDTTVYCGSFCIDSAVPANPPAACDAQMDACTADAGSD